MVDAWLQKQAFTLRICICRVRLDGLIRAKRQQIFAFHELISNPRQLGYIIHSSCSDLYIFLEEAAVEDAHGAI